MHNDARILKVFKNLHLFKDVDISNISYILNFFNAHIKSYDKNDIIKQLWEPVTEAGVILNGSIIIKLLSSSGTEHRIVKVPTNSIFGLSFAAHPPSGDTVEVVAAEKTDILFLKISNLFTQTSPSDTIGQIGINLLKELAQKNVLLNKKVEILSHHKIRDRVIVYLKSVSKGKSKFKIPLNREEMSSFLGVERTALSRELSKMQSDHLISYKSNEFTIIDTDFFMDY